MSLLSDADALAGKTRSDDYGHPADDFTRSGKMWGAILGIDAVSPEKVAMCMIAVKLSRLVQTPDHADTIVDIAGYAKCLEMIRERRQESHDD